MMVKETLAKAVQAHKSGQWQQAEALYRQVLQIDPTNADALHLLGLLANQAGQHQQAFEYISQALTVRPYDAAFRCNLGMVLHNLRRWDEAIACYREALRLRPNYPEAHNNMGTALQAQKRLQEALACYREALRLRPDFPEGHNNLGNVLKDQGRLQEAVPCFHEALRLRPDNPEAYNNLGNAFRDLGRLDEAADCFREALRLRPGYAEAQNNLGNVFKDQGRLEEAVARYQEALRLRPDFAYGHFNLGLSYLLLGQFERGWAEYEWRWRCPEFTPRGFRQRLWDGTPLSGQPILLYAEQGLGDALQFCRYAQAVKQRGGDVILECPPPLVSLLATCPGVDRVVAQGSALPEFSVQAPLLSLPGHLGTTVDTIPAPVPYLHADAQRRARWQQELRRTAVLNVGIVWQGGVLYPRDRLRSVSLEQFAPLAKVPGVRLVRLQRGPGSEQLAWLGDQWSVFDPTGWPEDPAESWLESAALVSALDLVVTVDTAVAHLAGALGVPVWVALPFLPDWRWLLGREDSPWYPTMRLFRQPQRGNWPDVFARMALALRDR